MLSDETKRQMERMCNDCIMLRHCSQNIQKDCYIQELEHRLVDTKKPKRVLITALQDIDDKLSDMEDEAHGEWGNLITGLRGTVGKALESSGK